MDSTLRKGDLGIRHMISMSAGAHPTADDANPQSSDVASLRTNQLDFAKLVTGLGPRSERNHPLLASQASDTS